MTRNPRQTAKANMKNQTATAATPVAIAAQIDDLRSDAQAADAAILEAEAAYAAGLVTETAAALRAILDGKADASIRADQARARIGVLERDHAVAVEAEAEDRRRSAYDLARSLTEAARARLFAEYDAACAPVRALLSAITEADIAVSRANADLPAGAEPIAPVESARGLPGLPGEIISQETVDHWCLTNGSEPILDPPAKPAGVFRDDLVFLREDDITPARRRKFVRTERLPAIPAVTPAALIASVSLPGLRAGEDPVWAPVVRLDDAMNQLVRPRTEPSEVAPRAAIVTFEPVSAPVA